VHGYITGDTKQDVAERSHSDAGIGVGGRRSDESRWLVEEIRTTDCAAIA
jgi:hypothetical protein